MNTTTLASDEFSLGEKPGAILASIREENGHSVEYVASKLHLRVRVIELLEQDAYDQMPESVFIKGYLRAYANLLEIESEPLLQLFNAQYIEEEPSERTLWQSRREKSSRAERWVRFGTALFAMAVLIAVVGWWLKNKEVESFFSAHVKTSDATTSTSSSETDIRLTDLSGMRSLLSPKQQLPSLEQSDD